MILSDILWYDMLRATKNAFFFLQQIGYLMFDECSLKFCQSTYRLLRSNFIELM